MCRGTESPGGRPHGEGGSKRPGDVRAERLCQEDRAVERLPGRRGLGRAGMLTSMRSVVHEHRSCSGIHPCGAQRGPGLLLVVVVVHKWNMELHPHWGPLNVCGSFIHARHRSHTCPDGDLLEVRITSASPAQNRGAPTHHRWTSQTWRNTLLGLSPSIVNGTRCQSRAWSRDGGGGGGTKPRPPRSRYALRLENLQRATAPLTGICSQQ